MTVDGDTVHDTVSDARSGMPMEELLEEVARRLDAAGLEHENPKVAAIPDARTMRFYASTGLLDQPVGIRDRRALYGERHVQQVVAVKRLQAAGLSLRQIRPLLAGMPTTKLRTIAEGELPREIWAIAPTDGSGSVSPAGAEPSAPRPTGPRSLTQPAVLLGVPLGNGVVALIPARRTLEPDDLEEIAFAGRPLLDHLLSTAVIDDDAKG